MNLLNENIIVSNIQRFSLHDGSGIRTTVFLKGCNLHCPWCANPENISFVPEPYKNNNNSIDYYGEIISLQTIYEEVIKDKRFYKQNGGVTFSGGEPLLQIKKLLPLLKKLHEEKILICFESALFVPEDFIKLAINYIDEIIIDIKILDKESLKKITDIDIELYYHNISLITKSTIPITFRVPLISPFTTEKDNIKEIISFLKHLCYSKIELIKGHNLGDIKYNSLINKPSGGGYKVPDLSDKQLAEILQIFINEGLDVSVCKI